MKAGKLLDWAKQHAPKALEAAGNLTGVKLLNRLGDLISGDNPDALTAEQIAHAQKLKELELQELELLLADMQNARSREVELAKAGKTDHMLTITVIVGLASFVLMVIAVIWIPAVQENDLFVHLMGVIEGVVVGNIFSYYLGTSKSSADKNKWRP